MSSTVPSFCFQPICIYGGLPGSYFIFSVASAKSETVQKCKGSEILTYMQANDYHNFIYVVAGGKKANPLIQRQRLYIVVGKAAAKAISCVSF